MRLGLYVLAACCLFGLSAAAQTLVPIENNGAPENRLDFVVIGDGYTAAQMSQFALDAQHLFDNYFSQEPWRSYSLYINKYRLEIASNESGASHPEAIPPVTRDNALGSTYNCAGIPRLICFSIAKVTAALSVVPAVQRDLVVVLVNDTQYGGAGGFPAVASLHFQSVEIALHEMGHSFGLLADEYGGPPPPACDASVEPSQPNVTKQTERTLIKWSPWIAPDTPIPTLASLPGVPGLYQGARYCDSGLYRPTYNSKMRSNGMPFEQINTEQLVRRIYNLVSPIDSQSPAGQEVSLSQDQSQEFSVTTPQLATGSLPTRWLVNGVEVARASSYTFPAGSSLGAHTVRAEVQDDTPLVRADPQGLLVEARDWTVNVTPTLPTIYLVGDPHPAPSASGDLNGDGDFDDVGEFGDDRLTVLDLIMALRASTLMPGYIVPACSDRFDAMDSFPVDTESTRGGDGQLTVLDLTTTLRRSTLFDPSSPRRAFRGLPCTAQAPGTGGATLFSAPERETQAGRESNAPDLRLEAGRPATAGRSVRIPIYLVASRNMNLVGMTFGLGLEGARVGFVAAGVRPALVDTGVPGMLAVAWLEGLSIRPGRVLLGYVRVESDRPVVPEALTWFRAEAVEANSNRSITIQVPQTDGPQQSALQ